MVVSQPFSLCKRRPKQNCLGRRWCIKIDACPYDEESDCSNPDLDARHEHSVNGLRILGL